MNQDQVKDKLLKLDDKVEDFTVIFSGKSSRKVDGLYKPEHCEIIIHNKNFQDDNALMYTAIHEFAHHVHFTRSPAPVSSRSHTNKFWDIFHKLLFRAEEIQIFENIFYTNKSFISLTRKIKENFLDANAHLMKEFGQLLIEAHELCRQYNASFEDYVDRVLGLHRSAAKMIIKTSSMDINPEIGFENMKTVASIKDRDIRGMAEKAFLEGKSPDMVKAEFTSRQQPDDVLTFLLMERDRLERSLEHVSLKLAKIDQRIEELKSKK